MEICCRAWHGGALDEGPALRTVLALLDAAARAGTCPPLLQVLVLDLDHDPGYRPESLRRAVNAVRPGGWVAVTTTCRGLDAGTRSGGGRLVRVAIDAGLLRICLQQSFLLPGVDGMVRCRAVVTRKAADIPRALVGGVPG